MADGGGDGDTKSFIKSKWIANQMSERAEEFTTLGEIIVFSGTWNVNGKVGEYPSPIWCKSMDGRPDGCDLTVDEAG
jgi:hypothetical protein